METTSSPDDRERRFRALYDETYDAVHRFARRRTDPDLCDDVVAETYLTVWRRLDDLPRADDPARAWVFGIARHVLLNAHRGASRRTALGVRLAEVRPAASSAVDAEAAARLDLARAWNRLSDRHQEVLALAVLEGLDATAGADVLDISPVAFRLRLSRARRALRAHLDRAPGVRSAVTAPTPTPLPSDAATSASASARSPR